MDLMEVTMKSKLLITSLLALSFNAFSAEQVILTCSNENGEKVELIKSSSIYQVDNIMVNSYSVTEGEFKQSLYNSRFDNQRPIVQQDRNGFSIVSESRIYLNTNGNTVIPDNFYTATVDTLEYNKEDKTASYTREYIKATFFGRSYTEDPIVDYYTDCTRTDSSLDF